MRPARASGPQFEASKIKIQRAEKHIAELDSAMQGFFSKKPFRAIVEPGETVARQVITFRVRKVVPKEFSAIIGDVIHNLRTALDLLASELVRLNKQSDEDVYFPFCDKADYLDTMIRKRHLDRAAPQCVELIRTLKPYTNGNVALRAIHDLDIQDKHKMLILASGSAGFGNAKFGDGKAHISVGAGVKFVVIDGFTLFTFPADPKLRIGQEIKTTFTLIFPPLGPLGAREVLPTLRSLAKLVSGIVESFEALGVSE